MQFRYSEHDVCYLVNYTDTYPFAFPVRFLGPHLHTNVKLSSQKIKDHFHQVLIAFWLKAKFGPKPKKSKKIKAQVLGSQLTNQFMLPVHVADRFFERKHSSFTRALTCDQVCILLGGRDKKEHLIHFLHEWSAAP